MFPFPNFFIAFCVVVLSVSVLSAQQVVRITEPSAINPAEVSIAINPKNPDNIIAASFQTGLPPKPRAGSYHYVTFDGGKTWKTVPTPDPRNLVQGDDVVAFSQDGIAYHVHLSFDGIRVARPPRAENGMIVNVSKDGGVFVMSSRDGGETWSAPVRVNDDAAKNGKVQFLPGWRSIRRMDRSMSSSMIDA